MPVVYDPALVPASLPLVILSFVTGCLGTLVSLLLISRTRDRRHGDRSRLSRRLLAAREDERRSIARGLHEDLGQLLTAIRLDVQRIEPAGDHAASRIAESVRLVDLALQRTRDLTLELRPAVLDDLGLGPAVRWLAARQADRAGYQVAVDDETGGARFAGEVENAAFRILREALTNIARHGSAQRVRITMRRTDGRLELTVADNGAGFDVPAAMANAEAGRSLGILDMRETAELAGGTLETISAPGAGTTLRLELPADPPA